jgi:hypothetical protein
MNDLRIARRMLSRSRGFTFAAAGLLAAGIGVTTLIFSAVDAILPSAPVWRKEDARRCGQL